MNALMVADAETAPADEPRMGPGRRLRLLRETQHLDVAAAANALHLSPAMLERLEADDYPSLPNAVFIQGYLRNYARYLGESPEPFLQAFNERRQNLKEERQDLRTARMPIKMEVRSNHLAVRLVTWSISLALLALLTIWGKGYLHDSGMLPETGLLPALPGGESQALPQPLTIDLPAATPNLPLEPTPPSVAAPPTSSTVEPLPTAESAKPPATKPPAQPVPTKSSEAPAALATGGHTAVAQTNAGAPAAEGGEAGYSVILEMVGKAWVDVRDANGKLVVVGELNPGEKRELTGKPPFSFVLGKASRVRITVNGKPFNIEQHAKRDVARFTFDPTAG